MADSRNPDNILFSSPEAAVQITPLPRADRFSATRTAVPKEENVATITPPGVEVPQQEAAPSSQPVNNNGQTQTDDARKARADFFR